MIESVLVELQLPADWKKLRMPSALRQRLQDLLDQQDRNGKLTSRERREAAALVELSDMLSLMRVRAELARRHQQE